MMQRLEIMNEDHKKGNLRLHIDLYFEESDGNFSVDLSELRHRAKNKT